jgi:hypothetical protein
MEPSITCPSCRTTIKLTETLAAPLIDSIRRENEQRLRAKDADIAKRETAIRQQQEALAKAKEAVETELASRLAAERKKLAEEETNKARAAFSLELHHKA